MPAGRHINDITTWDSEHLIEGLLSKHGKRYQIEQAPHKMAKTVHDTVSGRRIEFEPTDSVKEVYQRVMLADHYG